MLIEFEDAIVSRLKAKGINNTQAWSGKPEELFMKPRTYPAARLIIERLIFEELQSPYAYATGITGSIILFFQSLKDMAQGAYPVLENIINALSGYIAVGYILRVKKVELLFHEGVDFAYQVEFEGLGRYVVPYEEEEPLTTRIRTYEGENLSTEVYK
jgi:hypothetical protein